MPFLADVLILPQVERYQVQVDVPFFLKITPERLLGVVLLLHELMVGLPLSAKVPALQLLLEQKLQSAAQRHRYHLEAHLLFVREPARVALRAIAELRSLLELVSRFFSSL